MIRWGIIALLLLSSPARAAGVTIATIRSGDHPRFGRVVFDFDGPVLYDFSSAADHAQLIIRESPPLPGLPNPPRNIRAMTTRGGTVDFALAHGAHARVLRLGNRLIVDVSDPPRSARPKPERAAANPPVPVTPLPVPPAPVPPIPAPEPPVSASQTSPAPVAAASAPVLTATLAPVQQDPLPAPPLAADPTPSEPVAIAASRLSGSRPGILLPFPSHVGAAAFRRDHLALLVFDTPEPLDLAPLKADPVFGAATVQLLPAATLIRVPLAPEAALHLEWRPEGWVVRTGEAPAHDEPALTQAPGALSIAFHQPGQVVTVPDPETGGTMLVGTALAGRAQGISVPRRTAALHLLPTWLGIAIEPISDQVSLQARTATFVVHAPNASLSSAPITTALANAAALTRLFDFPVESTSALDRRLRAAMVTAATAPVRARFNPRLAVAEAMIALGLAPEAQAVLAVAREDDPQAAEHGNAAALQAVAALLAGRPGEASALNDPRFNGTDEIVLWRAMLAASSGQPSPVAAAGFAATMPLILAYPNALRAKLLPVAAETMVRGGQPDAADALLARAGSVQSLAFARALRLSAKHDTAGALAAFDMLAAGHDRALRSRAGIHAAELRLASGTLDTVKAADQLEALLPSWRGDGRELALRLRIAALRAQSGQFRPALDMLHHTKALFPSDADAITARMGKILLSVLAASHGPGLKPLELVAIAGDYADCIPNSKAGDRLADLLADRLAALDLPSEAAPVLARLMQATNSATQRARFGLRLASMRIDSGDGNAALDALQHSDGNTLPPALTTERALARARAQSLLHDLPGALATLSALSTSAADDMRASLLESARDWPGALAALRDLAAKEIPPAGNLTDAQQELVLREASAALQAGDHETLATLRVFGARRIAAGPKSDLLRLLTAPPIETTADLPRSARDVALAKQIPGGLQAISAR